MTKLKKILAALLMGLVCPLSPTAYGHGGGLDASGCHTDHSSGEYHCHRDTSGDTGGSGDDDGFEWGPFLLWTGGGLVAFGLFHANLARDSETERDAHSVKPEFRLTGRDAMGGLSWSRGALSAKGATNGEKLEGVFQLEFPVSR